jgi:hypothetical protein
MDEFSDGKAIFLKPSGVTHIYSTGAHVAKPDAIQYDKDGNEMAHWRFNLPSPKQKPYGYFRYDMQLDAWVKDKDNAQGVAFYTVPPTAQREWVWLTDEEIYEMADDGVFLCNVKEIARAIEAKLKEKNT